MTGEHADRDHLVELAVRDLGIIEDVGIVLGPAMTALTGETGAGKTLLVGAIELLLGARADPALVRSGATEAIVEGRFRIDGDEVVVRRVIPTDGRSRAYVDGRMATAAAVADIAGRVIDLHGQHEHQSLLVPATQRAALDRFAKIDLGPLRAARARRAQLEAELATLGGDAGARAREADLLRFQRGELATAALDDADEDERLSAEEDVLADALGHREAASSAHEALAGEGGAIDRLARAIAALDDRAPFAGAVARLRSLAAELDDASTELRAEGDLIDEDPARLAEIGARRQLLVELRRKYASAPRPDGTGPGDADLASVLAYQRAVDARLAELEGHDARAAQLEVAIASAAEDERRAAAVVARARRGAAPRLAEAIEAHLAELAMPSAKVRVDVGDDDPGDDITFLLAANPGTPPAPLAKVASGGELARSMLALRLVLSMSPPVLVFDEVDAGIGGRAAIAVGRALAALGADHQVLVVTHLPQVASYADVQVHVRKGERGGRTIAEATVLGEDERVVELSRMLSGMPESERTRDAAEELLATAAAERAR